LYIAYGSNCELETQILLSADLEFIDSNHFKNLQNNVGEVERMLKGLIKSLGNKT
jgi:four helix bundle protein